MFFRINAAIVVRTDFSSVFINQTCLSFEFKRLKLGQLFAISLSKRFRSFSSLFEVENDIHLPLPQRSNAHIFYLVGEYPGIYQSQFSIDDRKYVAVQGISSAQNFLEQTDIFLCQS
jgi:hypothetical protein